MSYVFVCDATFCNKFYDATFYSNMYLVVPATLCDATFYSNML
jgi:hypothetical protein